VCVFYPSGLSQVFECFELHVGGLDIGPLDSLTLLIASLDVLARLGTIINVNGYNLGSIHEMWKSA
jgi:hypothetical protein